MFKKTVCILSSNVCLCPRLSLGVKFLYAPVRSWQWNPPKNKLKWNEGCFLKQIIFLKYLFPYICCPLSPVTGDDIAFVDFWLEVQWC